MKIVTQGREVSLAEAIDDIITPDSYSVDGQLEKLKYRNDKLKEAFGRLLETIYGEEQYRLKPNEKLEHILGYHFEVTL